MYAVIKTGGNDVVRHLADQRYTRVEAEGNDLIKLTHILRND